MNFKNCITIIPVICVFLTISFAQNKQPSFFNSATNIRDAVHYQQISNFETDYSIIYMKMCAKGNKIVFATGGTQVKIFTIDTDGTGLREIYDFQTVGPAAYIDISADGTKILWCDRFGEIFVANSDGSNIEQIATLLPNPDMPGSDMEPEIPLPPRFTADGNTIFFLNVNRGPLGTGVWKVDTDDTNLEQVFSYIDVSSKVYGRDGSEYNYNTVFTDGFDINGDGSNIIFGIRLFKFEEGDFARGDAIVYFNSDFYKLCDYALSNSGQPFATNVDDGIFLVSKLETNPATQALEINVYFDPLFTGDPVKVIGGIDPAGVSTWTQISADNSRGIVHGANGRLPITFVDRATSSHFDLVSIDGISRHIGIADFSTSALPSINGNGDKFCFLSYSNPPQIWIGYIMSHAAAANPKIDGIRFDPYFVYSDGSSTSTIEAYVSDLNNPISAVTIQSFQKGSVYFRALTAEGGLAFYPFLFDDGTHGDQTAEDHIYTNNTVKRDLEDTPLGDYEIRIAAVNTEFKHITMVDVEQISIIENTTDIDGNEELPTDYKLYQNYPNPFNPNTSIVFDLPEEDDVKLTILNALGEEIILLVEQPLSPGKYTVKLNMRSYSSGLYFYKLRCKKYFSTKKMLLVK